MKRRDFLQRAGWTLAALGITEAGWLRLGSRYYQALAQPSPRKLALLIGINQYPHQALTGCLTDVELQRELLIHRFGFKPLDILTLTDQQASRQQIETAFRVHLVEQARPDDVVVFHFSGYGRRVQLETSAVGLLNSLVPVDGVVTDASTSAVNELLEKNLWLLLRSLPTNRVTTILDTSYNAATKDLQGNLRIRARPQLIIPEQLSQEAQDLQSEVLSRHDVGNLFDQSPPGVVLRAAKSSQLATEAQWSGFSAGLFTYALTQYLWEATPATSVQVSLSRVTGAVEQLGAKQQPALNGQKIQAQSQLAYYLMPDTNVSADGVVMAVADDGKTAQLWLAGLPLPVLEAYAVNSLLNVVTPTFAVTTDAAIPQANSSPIKLQIHSRTGLTAKAQRLTSKEDSTSSLQAGQLVQESIRVLPRNVDLVIALDTGLERIERVDATSAFAAISHISTVKAGEQPADYLFGRVQDINSVESPTSAANKPSLSRYGLFSRSQELIPDTAGEPGEAVKVAVQRLAPKLQTLLAAKLWRLTTNEGSSRLGVRATLEMIATKEHVIMQRETLHWSQSKTSSANLTEGNIPTISIGSRIQYRIYNDSDRPIYFVLLGLDTNKNAIALYPFASDDTAASETKPSFKELIVAPNETLTVPQPSVDFEWVIHGPTGVAETQLILSRTNFPHTMAALAIDLHSREAKEQIRPVLNPLEVAQAVLQDLHQASAVKTEPTSSATDFYALDVNVWAGLSFIYQVV